MKRQTPFYLAILASLLAACGEDRNGPGYHNSRVGYDVHAPEYHGHDDSDGDHDRHDRYEDNNRAQEDRNCPWKGSC